MKRMTFFALGLCLCCGAADPPPFPELPESPARLIEVLRTAGERYTVLGPRLDYVKESDLSYLAGLLDSKEPCAFVDLAESSIRYPGASTVGHEAAYLMEGFWKRYYPTELTSQRFKPDLEASRRWYRIWSRLKENAAAKPGAPTGQPGGHAPVK